MSKHINLNDALLIKQYNKKNGAKSWDLLSKEKKNIKLDLLKDDQAFAKAIDETFIGIFIIILFFIIIIMNLPKTSI